MASREFSVHQVPLHRHRQRQETERVGDRRPAAAHAASQLVMGDTEVIDELAVRSCLFQGVEICPVDVLDQGVSKAGFIISGSHDDRNRVQAGAARRSPAALARNDLELPDNSRLAYDDRLQDADLANRVCKSIEGCGIKVLPGLQRIDFDSRKGHLAVRRLAGGDQRTESPSESSLSLHVTAPSKSCGVANSPAAAWFVAS